MAIAIILIGYYLDYRAGRKHFTTNLKLGLTFFIAFIFYHLILKIWSDLHWLYIILAVGPELIIIFTLKAWIDSRKK